MDVGFGEALLYSGALLAIGAAFSGLMRGTALSIPVLSVAAGLILAEAGAIHVDAEDETVVHLFELALIVTLFSDGLVVERELLFLHWSPPVRALVLAMPLTLVLLALAAKALFSELSWAEAFLLGSVLSATDPVVTSAVVTSQRVPASVRHALNLESGLNDGLALPFVLFFIILASPGGDAGSEATKLLGEAAVGAVIGVALGITAGRRHLRQRVDRGLRLRHRPGRSRARHRRRLRRLQRERQLDPPGAHLLRLRRADRCHRLPREHSAVDRLHRLRPARRATGRDLALVPAGGDAQSAQSIHRLVRPEGCGGDALRGPRPQLRRWGGEHDLRGGGVPDPGLDHRARSDRHRRRPLDRAEDGRRSGAGGGGGSGAGLALRGDSLALAFENPLLLGAELGRGQQALLLQLSEPLEAIELRIVGVLVLVRELPERRADPASRLGTRPLCPLPHPQHPFASLGAWELVPAPPAERLDADARHPDQQQGEDGLPGSTRRPDDHGEQRGGREH